MTAPDSEAEPAAPSYTSPAEQMQEALAKLGLPWLGFHNIFEKLSASKGGGSGHFEFSLEEMDQLHTQFEAEAKELDEMLAKADAKGQALKPLARDPASLAHHIKAQEHHAKLLKAIQQQHRYAKGFAEAVKAAYDEKSTSDQAAGDAARGIQSGMS